MENSRSFLILRFIELKQFDIILVAISICFLEILHTKHKHTQIFNLAPSDRFKCYILYRIKFKMNTKLFSENLMETKYTVPSK